MVLLAVQKRRRLSHPVQAVGLCFPEQNVLESATGEDLVDEEMDGAIGVENYRSLPNFHQM